MDGFDALDRRDRARRDQPAGRARPGAAAARALRPPGRRVSRRTAPAASDPRGAHARDAARRRRRPRRARRGHAGHGRRRPRQPRQRGGADSRRAATTTASTMADFTDALEKILLGAERARSMMTEDDRRRTAYHEAGHAIVGMLTPGADPVRKVSIIPRGQALGVTFSAPDADRFNYDEKHLLGADPRRPRRPRRRGDRLRRPHDRRRVRHPAADRDRAQMVGRWGMSRRSGPSPCIPSDAHGPLLPGASETSEHTQQSVDAEVQRIVAEEHSITTALLREHRTKLDSLAQALLGRRDARRGRRLRRGRRRAVTHPARPAEGSRGRGANADRPHMTSFWRGFTSMGATRDREVRIVRGEGCRVWDSRPRVPRRHRRRSGSATSATAARRSPTRRGADARARRATTPSATLERAGARARRRASRRSRRCDDAPSSSRPAAAPTRSTRPARSRGATGPLSASPSEQIIVTRQHAYHGMNAYGTSLGGHPGQPRRATATLVEDGTSPWDDPSTTLARSARRARRPRRRVHRRAGDRRRRRDPAARRLLARGRAAICREHDVLFISDEVICGFGRLGTWFGAERYGVEPDLITCAKGITSGYVPLGAVIASAARARRRSGSEGAPPFRHGYTYSGPRRGLRGGAREPRHHRARGPARPRARARAVLGRGASTPFADSPARRRGAHASACSPRSSSAEPCSAAEPRLPDLIEAHARRPA